MHVAQVIHPVVKFRQYQQGSQIFQDESGKNAGLGRDDDPADIQFPGYFANRGQLGLSSQVSGFSFWRSFFCGSIKG
jgi:hypothetical protein